MARDIGYIVAQLNRIVTKSQANINKNLGVALNELPPGRQIKALKKMAGEMNKIHKAVMRLAIARSAVVPGQKRKMKIKKVYRTNVDTVALNVEQLSPHWMSEEGPADTRRLYKKGTSISR